VHARLARLEDLADARDRAAGADHRDEDVDRPVGIAPDLLGRRAAVDLGVRRVLELLRHEVLAGVRVANLLRFGDRARHAVGAGRQHELRAVGLEQVAALDRHRVGHRQDDRVAFGGRHERERDAGVPARRLDDHGVRPQAPVALGRLDHRDADAVLDAAGGIRDSIFTSTVPAAPC
jgi:hypothetical protein